MFADALFRGREWVSTLPAAVVLALLATASLGPIARPGPDESLLAVTLFKEVAPAPEVAPPEVSPPRAVREPPRPSLAMPTTPPATTESEPTEPAPPAREIAPLPSPAPAVREAAPPQSSVPDSAASPPSAAVETGYLSHLRAYLESTKRYPTSREARSMRPQGKVRLWLDIARDGRLREAGIEQSSGSMILDGAALSTARQGAYPPMPAGAFTGRATQRFHVTLDYQLEGG